MTSRFWFFASLGLLLCQTGCGRDHRHHAPDAADSTDTVDSVSISESELQEIEIDTWENEEFFIPPEAEEIDSSYIRQKEHTKQQLENLLEYSRNAESNDPFALSKERIEELSRVPDLQFQ